MRSYREQGTAFHKIRCSSASKIKYGAGGVLHVMCYESILPNLGTVEMSMVLSFMIMTRVIVATSSYVCKNEECTE